MSRRARGVLVRVGVSAGLIVLLFASGGVDAGQFVGVLGRARWLPLLGALGLYAGAGSLIRIERWRGLIQGLGHRTRFARAAEIFLVGTAFNQVLPTGIGGDVVRTVMLGRDGMGPARAASTVLVDRALGMLALLAAGLLTLALGGPASPLVNAVLVVAGCAAVVGGLALRRGDALRRRGSTVPLLGRIASHGGFARFVDSFGEYPRAALAAGFAWSLAFAWILAGTNRLLGLTFGIEQVSFFQWALLVPLIGLSLLIPSIGGLGVREWSYVGLLATVTPRVTPEEATAVSLTFQALNLALAAVGGVILVAGGRKEVAIDPSAPADSGAGSNPP